MPSTIFISAGEASGEHYGALLVAALRKQLAAAGQSASFFGMGGQRMAAEGLECVVRSEDMAVMGLTEVVRHLPRIYGEYRRLKRSIRERRPSVAVLIDFPEIHFRLAKEFHRLGIPVIYFVSPQLWAWKKKRIRLVRKYIDEMLVIFPFEEPFYRGQGVQAEFVGHPLAELPPPSISREKFAAANDLDPARTWIGLLPGSRPKEIRDILPRLLLAAQELLASSAEQATAEGAVLKGRSLGRDENGLESVQGAPSFSAPFAEKGGKAASLSSGRNNRVKDAGFGVKGTGFSPYMNPSNEAGALAPEGEPFEFLIPLAPTLNAAQREEVSQIAGAHGGDLKLRLIDDIGAEGAGGARAALYHSRASIVASGTATIEAALIGNPFVVVYRVSPLTFAIAKRVVKVPFVAMANLITGKQVVPELLQDDFTAENIVQHIKPLLSDGPARQSMMEELARIRGLLSKKPVAGGENSAIGRVAAVTLEVMSRAPRY